MTSDLRLEWVGFQKWRPGRIHIYCPRCRRRLSNAERTKHDPPNAALVHVWCEKCSAGCKTDLGNYFDCDGNVIREEFDGADV
jgi:hypothetical protein